MDAWVILLLLLMLLLVLLLSGAYVAVALGATAFFGFFLFLGGNVAAIIGTAAYNVTTNFVLLQVPLFIFMGDILLHTGFSRRLYRSVSLWAQYVPGNLLHSNILACTVFSAVSGSSSATAAAIGTIALPELERRGYDPKLSLGSLAAGGTLGPIIPPSIALAIYGSMTDTSVGQLFAGGVMPGLLLSALFMAYIGIRIWLNPRLAPPAEIDTWKNRIVGSVQIWPILALIFLVLGSIYLGVATPTEAAALGSVGALFLAGAYRSLSWQAIRDSLVDATRITTMIMFIVVGAVLLGLVLSNRGVPADLVNKTMSADLSPVLLIVILYVMYFILGMFFDGLSMMIITLPVTFPLVKAAGYDPVWWGIVMLVIIEVGLLTPPVGMNLYIIQGISRSKSFSDVVIGSVPFFMVMLVGLVIITVWPQIVLWLPRQMIG